MGGFRLGMPSFTRPKPLKTKSMRFSTWLASAILMWSAGTAWAQCDNLFFSEAAEGSSNNKYLEIYNPTGADVDLSGYAFPSVSNDPSVVGELSLIHI